jgi:hypothetical protein
MARLSKKGRLYVGMQTLTLGDAESVMSTMFRLDRPSIHARDLQGEGRELRPTQECGVRSQQKEFDAFIVRAAMRHCPSAPWKGLFKFRLTFPD